MIHNTLNPYQLVLAVEPHEGSAYTIRVQITPNKHSHISTAAGLAELIQKYVNNGWRQPAEGWVRFAAQTWGGLDADALALLGDDTRKIVWAQIRADWIDPAEGILLDDERWEADR